MSAALAGLDGAEHAILFVSALASALYLFMLGKPVSFRRTVAKTLGVGLLGMLALLAGGPWLLVAALALSALGDAFLAQEGDKAFLGGLGSFLAAHIVYAVLFLSSGPGFSQAAVPGFLAVAVFALGMGFLMVRKAGPLALPVAAYVLAIAIMGLGGVTIGGWVLLGVVAFMASDAILGSEKFLMAEASPFKRLTRPAVWVLYYAGQLLITLGLLA
ncbi:MAG: lysoplasmalogenase [Hoeflea sp.]|uniref:lysoplasmalogenase n=1 Tax=Hoeflea sp. TaxID=1940281 RepID=UPI002730D4E5|nr:lysoplasmalogenase [Hoeflea sp.]MDP2120382.1 lysoplasmalogenase [Hoeflea sp.]